MKVVPVMRKQKDHVVVCEGRRPDEGVCTFRVFRAASRAAAYHLLGSFWDRADATIMSAVQVHRLCQGQKGYTALKPGEGMNIQRQVDDGEGYQSLLIDAVEEA